MKAALLPDRGVVKVAGADAAKFLDGLVTADLDKVTAGSARYAALLTPQGKIIADFIVVKADEDDALLPRLPARAGADAGAAAQFLQAARQGDRRGSVRDAGRAGGVGRRRRQRTRPLLCRPAAAALGLRCMISTHLAGKAASELGATLVDAADYEAHRIALGVPRGGTRLHLQRRVSARGRHGPARRRRFRQGLLRRPGGRVAHGASRHRAHPRGAGRLRRPAAGSRRRGDGGRRRRSA